MYMDEYHIRRREQNRVLMEKRKKLCPMCQQKYFFPGANLCKSCANKRPGNRNSQWKGGKVKRGHNSSYIAIWDNTHPFRDCDNYVLEHRLVMERHIGRVLLPNEEVHHINGIKTDNRIENLMLFNNHSEHTSFENKYKKRNEKGRFV